MPCPSLPTELLDSIISLAARESPLDKAYTRVTDLSSFTLVNSQWHAIAQPKLLREPMVTTVEQLDDLLTLVDKRGGRSWARCIKSLTLAPHAKDEQTLVESFVDSSNFCPDTLVLHFFHVLQMKCFNLLSLGEYNTDIARHLTTLVLCHLELQPIEEDTWTQGFPELTTLELRQVTINVPDDDLYMHHWNDRASRIILPLGNDRRDTPRLTRLLISASQIGSLNLGDFEPLSKQITDLSLGVFQDHAFLEPKLLNHYTALKTFEFAWPREGSHPIEWLKLENEIETLWVRDAHSRFQTPKELREFSGALGSYVWESEYVVDTDELYPREEDAAQDEPKAASDPDEEEEDSDDDNDGFETEQERREFRVKTILDELDDYFQDEDNLTSLKTVYLPLKFSSGATTALAELTSTLDNLGIELNFGEREWVSDGAMNKKPPRTAGSL